MGHTPGVPDASSRDRADFVVEIGVGGDAPSVRPFASTASYVGVDVDPARLHRGVIPVAAADATHLPFPDHSVHHVVARNVFGDVGLGHEFDDVVGLDPPAYAAHVQDLVARGAIGELHALRDQVRAMTASVATTKHAILAEVTRVLRREGTLLVVETLTPQFARAWIENATGGRVKHEAMLRSSNNAYACRAVRSNNRLRRYCTGEELTHPSLEVWILTPIPGV